jgi:hypothetical protein
MINASNVPYVSFNATGKRTTEAERISEQGAEKNARILYT